MRFTRLMIATLFVTIFAAAASAQQSSAQPCTLKAESAPELRGLRLGMALEQVKARFPSAQITPGRFGLTDGMINTSFEKGPDAATLKGIHWIKLEFVDERLTNIIIAYQNSIRWENNEQFTSRVSEALRLPAAWKGGGEILPYIECDGFTVNARANHLSMTAAKPYEVVRQRQREQEEKERQTFLP